MLSPTSNAGKKLCNADINFHLSKSLETTMHTPVAGSLMQCCAQLYQEVARILVKEILGVLSWQTNKILEKIMNLLV